MCFVCCFTYHRWVVMNEIPTGLIIADDRDEERPMSESGQCVGQISADAAVRTPDAAAMRTRVHL